LDTTTNRQRIGSGRARARVAVIRTKPETVLDDTARMMRSLDYTRALVNSQVVPSYDDMSLPAVAEYRALMEKHNPQVPEALRDAKHPPEQLSFRSLEGFVNAKVIVEALRRAGPSPTRAGFRLALESLKGFELGIGAPLTFGPERHQGLDNVYFTSVVNGRWAPITDWAAAVRA